MTGSRLLGYRAPPGGTPPATSVNSLFIPEKLPLSLVLMLDTSSSMTGKLATARAAAKRFVKTLREEDLAEVVQFNQRTTTLQDYTSEQAALEGAIDRNGSKVF